MVGSDVLAVFAVLVLFAALALRPQTDRGRPSSQDRSYGAIAVGDRSYPCYHGRMPNPAAMPSRTPMSLMLRLKDGGDDDWRTFFAIYGPVIHGLARRNGLRAEDADDVVASVMPRLLKRLRGGFKVDYSKGRFRDYLARTVQRAIITQRRKSHRPAVGIDGLADMAGDGRSPVEQIEALERVAILNLCLARLRQDRSVRKRDVRAFERYALRDEPAKRVAKYYGVSLARLYGIKSEMLARIRAMTHDLEDGPRIRTDEHRFSERDVRRIGPCADVSEQARFGA